MTLHHQDFTRAQLWIGFFVCIGFIVLAEIAQQILEWRQRRAEIKRNAEEFGEVFTPKMFDDWAEKK